MRTRKRTSGGQALVLVTLALMAMAGMMGLAVDLGWSFFVKKQAQAAADGAAVAAVQEAYKRVSGNAGLITCGSNNVECRELPAPCNYAASDPSNLNNACLYATRNGFTAGGQSGRQNVTIQARTTTPVPTVPGVTSVRYWVTVRTYQSIPQLFSAVLGNGQGAVSAIATAAVVSSPVPASLTALNRKNDCIANTRCGVNFNLVDRTEIEAPGGIVVSSACNGTSQLGCGGSSGGSGSNFAGITTGSVSVETPITQVSSLSPSIFSNSNVWPGQQVAPSNSFSDPTRGKIQPPLITNSNGIPTCGVKVGTTLTGTAGAFNYFSYTQSGNTITPVAAPVRVNGVTFAAGGTCPSGVQLGGGSPQVGSFPSYYFYGGLDATTGTNNFGPGQYVVVGAPSNGSGGGSAGNAPIALNLGGAINGDTSKGTLMIVTAPGYPGLTTHTSLSPITSSLVQGTINYGVGTGSGTGLTGVVKGSAPASMDSYNSFVLWQDRRNSTVKYNADGSFNCAPPYTGTDCIKTDLTADKATINSPEFTIRGNAEDVFKGVIYQPRGGWMTLIGNGSEVELEGRLQIITGAVVTSGSGEKELELEAPTNPFFKYTVALIQ